MRAVDALEKICRSEPLWLEPYVDRIAADFASGDQPSIQWHIAQILRLVALTPSQRQFAISWLKERLSSPDVDWIVAANSMDTLAQFVNGGSAPKGDFIKLLNIQTKHKSNAVIKRANKLLDELS